MKKTLLGRLCPFSRHFSPILPSRIMLMFLVISLHAFQLQAADTVGKITLHANGKPLKEVLRAIEAQTDYRFFYSTKLVDENKKVSVDANNASINTVVAEILKADPTVTFKIKGDQIMIKRQRNAAADAPEGTEAPAAATTAAASAPTEEDVLNAGYENDVDPITITGTVLDETNTPLPGVSVVIKGTTIGTATDADGKYSLSVPDLSATSGILVYSFIGYMAEEVPVNGRTAIDVNLVPDISTLSEVVVVGFGTVKKRDLTGSVASVKTTELTLTPTHNAVESMQGRVPGVDIVRNSGNPGATSTITIRGNRTINGAQTTPLYVVDGVQIPLGGDLSNINPNDIESVEVLKDASATAIYGAMGSNGVVIVTTKRGSEGKTKVSYSGYYGISTYDFPEGRTGDDYIKLRREANRTTGIWASPADDSKIFTAGELDAIAKGQWANWVDLVKHDGRQQSHSVSITSGGQKTKIFASGNYFREDGMLNNQDFSRYNVRFNLDQTVNDWAKIGVLSQINYTVQNVRNDPFSQALSLSPLAIPYDTNGVVAWKPLPYDQTKISPLADERTPFVSKDNTIAANVLANAYIEIKPIKELTFRSNFGTSLTTSRRGVYQDKTSLNRASNQLSIATSTATFSRSYNWDNVLTFAKDFESGHTIGATGIISYIQSDTDVTTANGTGQLSPDQLYYTLAGTTPGSIGSPYTGWKNMAYAGRLNYGFMGKYLITLSGRYDGASRLAPGNKWSFFPSVALGWNISDESFMSGIEQISHLKVRASYGSAGNYSINEYGTQGGIVPTTNSYFGDTQQTMYTFKTTAANPNLGWERTTTSNIGLDIELLNGIVTGTFDLYKATTTDILTLRNLPPSSGLANFYQNIGETQNKGIEISITSRNISTNDFKWSSTVTFTSNKEELTKLIDGKDIISSNDESSLLIGRPIKSFYAYEKTGIWQTNEADEAAKYRPIRITNAAYVPGDIKIKDQNGDFLIDATNDRKYLGSTVPKWVAGLQNNFTYKAFDLGVFVFARWGQMINAKYLGRFTPSGQGNGPAYLNYWTPENPTNDYPSARSNQNNLTSYTGYTGYGSLNFVDGSYFKVKNVTFGYTLPSAALSKLSISRVRFYVTGSNLFVKAKSHLVKYYDPERGGEENSPLGKTYVFGVNVDF